jgi:hypothetical protein
MYIFLCWTAPLLGAFLVYKYLENAERTTLLLHSHRGIVALGFYVFFSMFLWDYFAYSKNYGFFLRQSFTASTEMMCIRSQQPNVSEICYSETDRVVHLLRSNSIAWISACNLGPHDMSLIVEGPGSIGKLHRALGERKYWC